MIAQWTGRAVGKMHIHRIENRALAKELGVTSEWVSIVLNGKREPAGAEQRFMEAIDRIIAREGEGKA